MEKKLKTAKKKKTLKENTQSIRLDWLKTRKQNKQEMQKHKGRERKSDWITLSMFSFHTLEGPFLMREMQENYYLILFMFASQLYFYVLGPSSLLGY